MGRFSTTVHVKDNVGRIEFINFFCGIMKNHGFVPCSEDEAEQSYVFAFGDGWVTLVNKDYKDDRLKAGDDAMNMSAALKTSAFMMDVIDSDFAYIHLFAPNGGKDGVAVGDTSGYGVEKPKRGKQKFWKPLLAEGKTWEQFSETVAKNAVFVEETLVEMAEELKIDPDYIYADFNELMNLAADKDCHRRRFKTKLIAMGMRGLDRVIVEPSGIYEADEFFDVLREEPLDNWYEIGSVITIADACLDTNLSEASDYLLASQLSEAGIVLMSRCQEATKQELEDTLKHLEAVQKKFHCHRMTKPEIIMKDWSELTDEDMERIANSGYEPDSHEKLWFDKDKAYTSLYFMNMKLPDNAMEDAVSRLMSDSKCGRIFRVKGFMQNAEGKWLELNATHKNITVKPIERGQAVFIVIGEGLDKEHIDGYFVPV